MTITTIRIPAHFVAADYADMQREIIGLIWDKCPRFNGVAINIIGVRSALVYHAPNAEWPSLRHSKVVRTPDAFVQVSFERA